MFLCSFLNFICAEPFGSADVKSVTTLSSELALDEFLESSLVCLEPNVFWSSVVLTVLMVILTNAFVIELMCISRNKGAWRIPATNQFLYLVLGYWTAFFTALSLTNWLEIRWGRHGDWVGSLGLKLSNFTLYSCM